jgi:hypothetical protein
MSSFKKFSYRKLLLAVPILIVAAWPTDVDCQSVMERVLRQMSDTDLERLSIPAESELLIDTGRELLDATTITYLPDSTDAFIQLALAAPDTVLWIIEEVSEITIEDVGTVFLADDGTDIGEHLFQWSIDALIVNTDGSLTLTALASRGLYIWSGSMDVEIAVPEGSLDGFHVQFDNSVLENQ